MRTVVGVSLLFSMFALACGAPEPESLGKTKGRSGDASSAEQAYADPMGAPLEDGGAMGPVTDPTTPPPPPTPAPVDGGAIGDAAFPIPPPPDASQVGTNGRVPCYDLAYCCAMAKPCDAETVACVKVVQTQDPTACLAALEGYKIIKCIHGDEANASFLPGFAGCQPDWGWGY